MKKLMITALAGLTALGTMAEGLSLRDRAEMTRQDRNAPALRLTGNKVTDKVRRAVPKAAQEYVSALVELKGDFDESSLGDNVSVKKCRAGFAIVTMPRTDVERVASHPAMKSFSLAKPVNMKLDRARLVSGIDKIHTGEGLPRKYTGAGIVAGVVDNGIDPNHVNFLYPDGSSRISMLSEATIGPTSEPTTVIYNAETVRDFTTDDKSTYHGTHTLGILGGSYDGTGKMAYKGANGEYNIEDNCERAPFYGVAPAADLAVGAGSDNDAYIVYNIENILNYANFMERRVVINLSLGSSLGPHDGSTSLNRYLDYICMDGEYEIDGQTYKGDNAIICISAGNEGDMPIAWNKTISATDPEAKSFYISLQDDIVADEMVLKNMRMGHMYVYGNDARPFKIQLVAWNNTRNRAAWQKTLVEASDAIQYYCSENIYVQDDTDIVDPAFANYFEGFVGLGTTIDEESGRYMAIIDLAAIDNVTGTFNQNEEYSLGLVISYIADDGKPQRIEAYGDADGVLGMDSLDKEGWIKPNGNGTISDMACGRNQIIVGSYNSKEAWLSLDSQVYGYGEGIIPEGEVTGFSSFGTLHDGRNLPHVLAPGATIVSSSNIHFHTEKKNITDTFNPMHPGVRQGETSFGGRDHYWVQMSGTSMSSPLVAGTMALWLEADPTLNVDDIRDIIARTSVKDEFTAKEADQVKVGAGKLDAYAGLKEVLRRSSVQEIESIPDSDDLLLRALGNGLYEVSLPGAESMNVMMLDAAGHVAARVSNGGDEAVIDASALASGLYIISVNGTAAAKIIKK